MKRGIWLSLFVLFVYFLSYAGIQHSIDELATFSLSESILHGSTAVNRMEWEQERYPPQNAYGDDDNLYSKKGLGSALTILPFLFIGKFWDAVGAAQLSFLTSALITSMTVFIFYLTACLLGYKRAVSTLSALALGLGTLLWPYAQMLFSEPIAALGVAISLLGLVCLWKALERRWLFLCGVGGGLIILSRSANALLVLPFFVAVAYRLLADWYQQKNWAQLLKNGVAFALPISIVVLAIVLNNYLRFGSLLSFPTVEGEAFTTPLWVGVSGQLWSSGKGLVFYVPISLMIILSLFIDFRKMISPLYLTAFLVFLIPLLFYGAWYDWPGGKAWGPRFIVPTMPALIMLCLPAINWLIVSRPKWRRGLLALWLLLTFLMQLPGVLVNFDYQETLDGRAGATYQDLLWNWTYSPLITYWNKVLSGSANLVWLHSFFWENSTRLLALIGLLIVIIILMHFWLTMTSRGHTKTAPSYKVLVTLGFITVLLGGTIVFASREDPRWWERTEDIETNREVREFVDSVSSDSDIILLDLIDRYDRPGRVWEWLNEAPFTPDYIGFKRKPEISEEDIGRLQNWLSPHPRVWLILQATPYAAPESTTENWLRTWAYEGQNQWLASQRVVEYLIPVPDNPAIAEGTAVFQTDPPLSVDYNLTEGKTPSHILLELNWEETLPQLNYSVQAMNADQSQLLQQIDKPINSIEDQRLGFFLPIQETVLLLRVYDPSTQTIYSLGNSNGELEKALLLKPAEH